MRGTRAMKWMVLCMFVFATFALLAGGAFAAEKKEILIGTTMCLTGEQAAPGADLKWAYEQAVADVNKKGGILITAYGKKLPVKLVVFDDESDPSKAATGVEKLIKFDKVDLLLTSHSTPLVMANCITAEKYKKYIHATACIVSPWLEQKLKYSTIQFFSMDLFGETPFNVMKLLPPADRIQRPALMMDTTPDGKFMGTCFRDGAKRAGMKLVADEEWSAGAKDYSSVIMRLKEKDVDAILTVGNTTDLVTFVRQMKENKLNVKYFHGAKGAWEGEFAKALGKDSDYVVSDGMWSESFPYTGTADLAKRYFDQFHKKSVVVGSWYASAQTLLMAIGRAGSLDSLKVRAAVVNNEFKDTMMGDLKYGPDGVALYGMTAAQWRDGQLKLVYPQVKGTVPVAAMPPWDKR